MDYEAKRIRDEGKDMWLAEGEATGRLKMLFNLVCKGRLTDIEASEEVKKPISDFKARMA